MLVIKKFSMMLGGCALFLQIQAQAQVVYAEQFIESTEVYGLSVADFNRDGHDDLFIHGHDQTDRVWYWTATGYTPPTQVMRSPDRHACTVADFNQDLRLDIFCSQGADKGEGMKLNELYLQNSAGTFVKQVNFGAEDLYGRGRRPVAFDMNHDGFPDLYLTNYSIPRTDGMPNINQVFINQAGNGFLPINTIASGSLGSLCVGKGDVNQDGWDDLVVCDKLGTGHVLINNRAGDFVDLAATVFKNNYWRDAKLVDVNGDGRDDLVVLNTSKQLQVWLNTGSGKYFPSVSFQVTLPYFAGSLAVADLNGDGLKDIYVVLSDDLCPTGRDLAPDMVFFGQSNGGWRKVVLPQNYLGCGYQAAAVDGNKILLSNGGGEWAGPSYILSFK